MSRAKIVPSDGLSASRKEPVMLVLSRQRDETIMIGDDVEVTVVDIRGDKVRLGVEAPKEVPVHRREVYDAIQRNARAGAEATPGTPSDNHTASEADQAG